MLLTWRLTIPDSIHSIPSGDPGIWRVRLIDNLIDRLFPIRPSPRPFPSPVDIPYDHWPVRGHSDNFHYWHSPSHWWYDDRKSWRYLLTVRSWASTDGYSFVDTVIPLTKPIFVLTDKLEQSHLFGPEGDKIGIHLMVTRPSTILYSGSDRLGWLFGIVVVDHSFPFITLSLTRLEMTSLSLRSIYDPFDRYDILLIVSPDLPIPCRTRWFDDDILGDHYISVVAIHRSFDDRYLTLMVTVGIPRWFDTFIHFLHCWHWAFLPLVFPRYSGRAFDPAFIRWPTDSTTIDHSRRWFILWWWRWLFDSVWWPWHDTMGTLRSTTIPTLISRAIHPDPGDGRYLFPSSNTLTCHSHWGKIWKNRDTTLPRW